MKKISASTFMICIVGLLWVCAPFTYAQDPVSVYTVTPAVDYPILVAAALGAGVPILFENQLIRKSEFLDRSDVNRFDRPATRYHSKAAGLASHLIIGAALITPVIYERVTMGWNAVFLEDMLVYTQALAIQSSVANLARFTSKRPRPDAYAQHQPVSLASEYESFYSGHTGSIFAGLTALSMTYTYRHGPSPWPWVLTAGVGVTQGALRIAAGRHFYSDVLVGIGVGTLIGVAVPMLHHHQREKSWTLMPTATENGGGLVWQKTF